MFQETIKRDSREAIISANEATGPFTVRLYVNNGETPTATTAKTKGLASARKAAFRMLNEIIGACPECGEKFPLHAPNCSQMGRQSLDSFGYPAMGDVAGGGDAAE